jgi:hypothetical protein
MTEQQQLLQQQQASGLACAALSITLTGTDRCQISLRSCHVYTSEAVCGNLPQVQHHDDASHQLPAAAHHSRLSQPTCVSRRCSIQAGDAATVDRCAMPFAPPAIYMG